MKKSSGGKAVRYNKWGYIFLPHAQTGTQSNHQSLQNVHCTVKEFHSKISFGLKKATLHTPEIHLLKHRKLRQKLIC